MNSVKLLFVLVALLFVAPSQAAVAYYLIPETPQKNAPGLNLERYIEGQERLEISQALFAPFVPVAGFVSRRYSGDGEWYRFALQESVAGQERVLEFGSLYLNHIDVYLLREGGVAAEAQHFHFGDHVPMSARENRTRSYILPLELEPGERVTVYVRTESNSAMTLYALLWNRDDFELHDAQMTLAHGVYFGLVGGLFLLFLPLALLFRRREYIAFAVLGMALLLLNFGTYGYVRVFFPEVLGWLPDTITGLGTLGLVVASGLIFIALLNLRRTSPPLYWITSATVVVAISGIPFVAVDAYRYFAQLVHGFNSLLVLPLMFFAIYRAWSERAVVLAFYAAGFISTVVGGGIQLLAIAGVIFSSDWTLAAYQLSTVVQMVLLGLGLGIEWWQSVREKNRFMERAMLAESRSALLHNLTRFLSHELITPLAAAKRAVEMIERQPQGISTPNRRRLERAKGRLAEIGRMAQVFLGREGRGELAAVGKVALREVVESGLALVEEAELSCRVRYECDADTPVRGALSLLSHALRNLVDNALRHGGGVCRITAVVEEGRLLVRVEDDGPGVEAATLEQFNLGQGGKKGEISGLALVKFFMELQGGGLRLESHVDRGFVATMELPVAIG